MSTIYHQISTHVFKLKCVFLEFQLSSSSPNAGKAELDDLRDIAQNIPIKLWSYYYKLSDLLKLPVKSLSRAQNGGHFENFEILNTASILPQIWKDRPKLYQKSIFMMMTSSMTSQGGLKVGPLYSIINEITTFFMITKKRAKISSSNFLCIGIMSLWLQLYKYIFMTSLMTPPGNKIRQILTLIYLRQYLS